jgi:probable F420-dependent oxidoreductase
MEFGIGYFPTHDGIAPSALAQLLEERGHESLFVAEHTHIPVVDGPPRDPGGGPLQRRYWHTYDPFVALTAAATVTTRLRVGTGICLLIERDPITTAKEVASLDHLSGGRFEFGVGAGWNRQEMANHGTDPRTRMRRLKESVEAMKEIWTQDTASYHGEFVNFDSIWSWPKPAQKPHPPVLVGGDGPTVADRVLDFGDGWIPNNDDDVIERAAEMRALADRPIDFQVLGVDPDPALLERLEKGGASRVLHWVQSGARGTVEPQLERWERAIAELYGSA